MSYDDNMQILVLVSGTLTNGQQHFAYVGIPPSKYDAFKTAEAAGNYELSEFGEILEHGEGLQPSPEIEEKMIEKYGISHLFAEAFEELRKP